MHFLLSFSKFTHVKTLYFHLPSLIFGKGQNPPPAAVQILKNIRDILKNLSEGLPLTLKFSSLSTPYLTSESSYWVLSHLVFSCTHEEVRSRCPLGGNYRKDAFNKKEKMPGIKNMPPVIDEVKIYFSQKGVSNAEAETFFLFYEKRLWTSKRGNLYHEWKGLAFRWILQLMKETPWLFNRKI
jgi:hypothetical protein